MAEDRIFNAMLFDFYGELLTDKQREYYDLHYNEDLSLAEIAQSDGISRQGVWDIIRRAEESMLRYEERTGLVERFARQRELLDRAEELTAALVAGTRGKNRAVVQELRHGI